MFGYKAIRLGLFVCRQKTNSVIVWFPKIKSYKIRNEKTENSKRSIDEYDCAVWTEWFWIHLLLGIWFDRIDGTFELCIWFCVMNALLSTITCELIAFSWTTKLQKSRWEQSKCSHEESVIREMVCIEKARSKSVENKNEIKYVRTNKRLTL